MMNEPTTGARAHEWRSRFPTVNYLNAELTPRQRAMLVGWNNDSR